MFDLLIRAIRFEAPRIHSFELASPAGDALPAFEPGAHIDLHLPGGLVRSYSLLGADEGEGAGRRAWRIAVQHDLASRGGSRLVHERLHVGDLVAVDGPRNNFRLEEGARHSVLMAGGIGITPIGAMVRRLAQLGRSWTLHYAVRDRRTAAFAEELTALGDHVHLHVDDEAGGRLLDIAGIVAAAPAGAHLYCCGPLPMLAAFEAATAEIPGERVHVEYFTAKAPPATSGGFVVELARSGRSIEIPAGESILEAVLDLGIDVPNSCREGVCASCETRVLEGVPDHRDLVLTREEQAANTTMMICCSGSKTERLVLDL